ncbi:C-GCAxxG-C-C family protein [Oscillibacter sp.]|jgi:C_GCAxxG_C_C family probable redox protein|uniref:C-GCAxxG-C-C family protein n=1 Tax=Oscillibacter sp. TaxID=1945593 RepID=UPI00216B9239|nr:C-GCAxxG-C-C family protein [Oscillibacter sp.]MCI9649672.1 C_GCAxxG_C_C family protein [Oscillibacter sp.]
MDRCALAYEYHKKNYNCAQAVTAAFADLTGWTEEQLFSAAGSFGGGYGGSHEEACGAVSGALLVLGVLFPFTGEGDIEAKRKIYGLAKDFRQRYFDVFGYTRCRDLLKARPGVSERTPAARRLGVTAHCDVMIVTAVELLEELLREQGKL